MEHKEYNGYTNYETWLVGLWIDNDEGLSNMFRRDIESDDEMDSAKDDLADEMKQYFEDEMPKVEGFWADILNSAFGEIDWADLADGRIEKSE
jgi:hypothetical protein